MTALNTSYLNSPRYGNLRSKILGLGDAQMSFLKTMLEKGTADAASEAMKKHITLAELGRVKEIGDRQISLKEAEFAATLGPGGTEERKLALKQDIGMKTIAQKERLGGAAIAQDREIGLGRLSLAEEKMEQDEDDERLATLIGGANVGLSSVIGYGKYTQDKQTADLIRERARRVTGAIGGVS